MPNEEKKEKTIHQLHAEFRASAAEQAERAITAPNAQLRHIQEYLGIGDAARFLNDLDRTITRLSTKMPENYFIQYSKEQIEQIKRSASNPPGHTDLANGIVLAYALYQENLIPNFNMKRQAHFETFVQGLNPSYFTTLVQTKNNFKINELKDTLGILSFTDFLGDLKNTVNMLSKKYPEDPFFKFLQKSISEMKCDSNYTYADALKGIVLAEALFKKGHLLGDLKTTVENRKENFEKLASSITFYATVKTEADKPVPPKPTSMLSSLFSRLGKKAEPDAEMQKKTSGDYRSK